jgi:hypothetical protein
MLDPISARFLPVLKRNNRADRGAQQCGAPAWNTADQVK